MASNGGTQVLFPDVGYGIVVNIELFFAFLMLAITFTKTSTPDSTQAKPKNSIQHLEASSQA